MTKSATLKLLDKTIKSYEDLIENYTKLMTKSVKSSRILSFAGFRLDNITSYLTDTQRLKADIENYNKNVSQEELERLFGTPIILEDFGFCFDDEDKEEDED